MHHCHLIIIKYSYAHCDEVLTVHLLFTFASSQRFTPDLFLPNVIKGEQSFSIHGAQIYSPDVCLPNY